MSAFDAFSQRTYGKSLVADVNASGLRMFARGRFKHRAALRSLKKMSDDKAWHAGLSLSSQSTPLTTNLVKELSRQETHDVMKKCFGYNPNVIPNASPLTCAKLPGCMLNAGWCQTDLQLEKCNTLSYNLYLVWKKMKLDKEVQMLMEMRIIDDVMLNYVLANVFDG